jgi:hypothetical protein
MPVKDIDGGLNFQFYSPRLFNDRLPKEQYVSRPFFFGGSQVPIELNAPQLSSQGGAVAAATRGSFRPHMRKVATMPIMRKKF